MRKILHSLLLTLALAFTAQAYSQATLWAGYRSWSGGSNNIYGFDTTGGTYTLSTTLALTSDFTGAVQGVKGMSLNPNNGLMYINYQGTTGGGLRRLGTVDLTTGDITDIGPLGDGNISDIAFVGGILYGTGGQCGGAKELFIVNITDGTTTSPGNMTGTCSDHSLVWDYYGDRLLRQANTTSDVTEVDVSDASESASIGTITGWTHGIQMKNDSTIIFSDGNNIRELDLSTGTSSGTLGTAGGTIGCLAFDGYPLYVIVNGPTTFCANDSSQLASSESGTAYQWNLDGTPIAGATDSTWYPVASGSYTVDVDGQMSVAAQIIVYPAPVASFTAAPNPVDLGADPSGQVTFTNTSTGPGGGYWWDFDNGFTSTTENPTFPFTTVGSYDITFIVTDTVNGCMDTAWVTVTVINSTGIGELENGFKVYPTSADDVVTISRINAAGTYQIEMISMTGQSVMSDQIVAGTKSTELSIADLQSGPYLIKVFNDEGQSLFKVIKR